MVGSFYHQRGGLRIWLVEENILMSDFSQVNYSKLFVGLQGLNSLSLSCLIHVPFSCIDSIDEIFNPFPCGIYEFEPCDR